jgi:hypothetical protein
MPVSLSLFNSFLSGETIFLGWSDVGQERGLTGVTSFLWDRKDLMQAAYLYVQAPEST